LLDFIHPNWLALLSAALISSARVMQRYAISRMTAYAASLILGMVTTSMAWMFYFVEGPLDNIPLKGVLWFIAVGFFGAGCGRYLYLNSVKLTGLARTTVASQIVMVWSATLAIVFLGERMTPAVALGTLAIMFGASFLVYKEKEEVRRRIPVYYYSLPVLSALMYAFAHLTAKYAFVWIPSPAFGMAISNTTSIILILCMMPFTNRGGLGQLEWRGLAAILAGALVQSFGILVFWSAVKTGDLTQVIPLSRLSVLVIIFLSWLFFRDQEAVTWKVAIGGIVALAGAFAVAGGW
jgi:uncharacterized membrane protein